MKVKYIFIYSIFIFTFPVLAPSENFKEKVEFFKNKRIGESLQKLEIEKELNELLLFENELNIEIKNKPTFKEKFDNTPITITEIDLFRNQIYSCLNLNAGVSNLKEIKPEIFIEVNPNRTLKSAKVVNKELLSDPSFRTAAEASLRAINNPDCNPFNLPEGKYEQWKEIYFTFDYSWMFD
mgnify:FL=1